MELLKDHIPHDTQDMEDYFARNDYVMMLIGVVPSSLGPRREVNVDDFKVYGEWVTSATPPSEAGFYIVEGSYENFDGKWETAILPAWYHVDLQEWEVADGVFTATRLWMDIPYLPHVWEEARVGGAEVTAS